MITVVVVGVSTFDFDDDVIIFVALLGRELERGVPFNCLRLEAGVDVCVLFNGESQLLLLVCCLCESGLLVDDSWDEVLARDEVPMVVDESHSLS